MVKSKSESAADRNEKDSDARVVRATLMRFRNHLGWTIQSRDYDNLIQYVLQQ